MASFFQLVAPVLVVAILGGTQCTQFCSFLGLERQATALLASAPELPCHQHQSPTGTAPPVDDEQCSHHELLAVKAFEASSADHFQTVSVVAVRIEARIVPVPSPSPLSVVPQHFPGSIPLALASILRI